MRRHETLGLKIKEPEFLFNCYLPKRLEEFQKFTMKGAFKQESSRCTAIERECVDAVLEHMGFGPIPEVSLHLNRAMDYCVDYYLGDWWRQEPTPELIAARPYDWKDVCERDAIIMDKSRSDWVCENFYLLNYVFMLGGLTNRWSDVEKISRWFDEAFDRRFHEGRIVDERDLMLVCMAIVASGRKTVCLGDMLNVVRNVKSKRTKQICAAWEAAIAKDQTAFDKAFPEGVKVFVTKEIEDVPNVIYWFALIDTAIWAIAERNGLKFPKLNDKCEAVVIRRETIGLT